VVGLAVRRAQALGVGLDQLPLLEFQAINPVFNEDVGEVFDFRASANRRAAPGGTAEDAVLAQLAEAQKILG